MVITYLIPPFVSTIYFLNYDIDVSSLTIYQQCRSYPIGNIKNTPYALFFLWNDLVFGKDERKTHLDNLYENFMSIENLRWEYFDIFVVSIWTEEQDIIMCWSLLVCQFEFLSSHFRMESIEITKNSPINRCSSNISLNKTNAKLENHLMYAPQ